MPASDVRAGGAFVELLLKDGAFTRGLAAAKQKLIAFGTAAAGVGAVVAAAGAAVVGYGLKAFVDMGSALQDMSDRTGVAVESLSELQYAAKQTGTDLGAVEKALRFMAKNGMDVKSFNQVAASIAAIADPTERAQAAMQVWGKSGTALLPMIGDLGALRQQARDLGLVMSSDAAGAADQLGDSFDTLWASLKMTAITVASELAPALQYGLDVLQVFVTDGLEKIKSWHEIIQAVLGSFADSFRTAWDYAQKVVDAATKAISFAIFDWRKLLNVAMIGSELGVVRFSNQVVYWFTEALPGYLSWFGDHWREVFTDIWNGTKTILGNIWTNLSNFWDAIVGLFNGEGFNFEWTPLTQGFESAITELPKIAERQMGPLEKQLQGQLDAAMGDVMKDWQKHSAEFDEKVAARQPLFSSIPGKTKLGGAKRDVDAFDLKTGKNPRDEIFATFSAAAAQAQGQGGLEDTFRKETKEQTRAIVGAIREGGVLG